MSTRAVQYGGVSPLAVSRLLSVLLRFLGFFRCLRSDGVSCLVVSCCFWRFLGVFRCLRSDGVSCHVVSVSVLSRVAFRVFDRV